MENITILILFSISYIYIIINTIIFSIYKNKIKHNQEFYDDLYYHDISNKKFLYMMFPMFMILYNNKHKDEIKLRYYIRRKNNLSGFFRCNRYEQEEDIKKIDIKIRQLDLKIKIKSLKGKNEK